MAESVSVKMFQLESSDGLIEEVEEAEASLFQSIMSILKDCTTDDPIPLPTVHSTILSKVVEYCKFHVKYAVKSDEDKSAAKTEAEKSANEKLKAFDQDFVKVDRDTLFDLLLAANYLNIESLLDLTCQTIADKIKDFSPEDVRTFFNITGDFTKQEEAEIRKANAWAFQ